jgi:hypothetical protein
METNFETPRFTHNFPRSGFTLEQAAADFHRDGFVLLKNFVAPEKLMAWAAAFRPLLEHHLAHYADPSFRGPERYYVTLPFRAPFNDPEIFEGDALVALLEKIAGPDFVMCQLATDTPLKGSDYQAIHADAPPLFAEGPVDTPAFQLALNFPLCDVTRENGPLEITRGTHRMPKAEGLAKVADGTIPIEALEMKLGDVLVRDVRGLHRGTPNRTAEPRPMVVIGYSRKWFMRPEVSIQIPEEEFSKLSPRAKHMLRFNPRGEPAEKGPETYKSFAY